MSGRMTTFIAPQQVSKPKKTKYGRYVQDITKEEIEAVFCYPAEEACVRLGICLTILKRLCRKHGISRWPYRRLKCSMRYIDGDEKSILENGPQSPQVNSGNVSDSEVNAKVRRTERPQRQAALGVQNAIVRAKADIYDDEVATVQVKVRQGRLPSPTTHDIDADPEPPSVPNPHEEVLAYQSFSADESQALGVLLGAFGGQVQQPAIPVERKSSGTSVSFPEFQPSIHPQATHASIEETDWPHHEHDFSHWTAPSGLELLLHLQEQQKRQEEQRQIQQANLVAALTAIQAAQSPPSYDLCHQTLMASRIGSSHRNSNSTYPMLILKAIMDLNAALGAANATRDNLPVPRPANNNYDIPAPTQNWPLQANTTHALLAHLSSLYGAQHPPNPPQS